VHHPQRQVLTDGDGVGVGGVGLAALAGVEHPDPRRPSSPGLHDPFAFLDQALGQRTAGAVSALHRPHPVDPAGATCSIDR
jgi:hypothetical protein